MSDMHTYTETRKK